MNVCAAKHSKHDVIQVDTNQGFPMFIYDALKYKDTYGYCTGDDDVSRTIKNTSCWEPSETKIFLKLMEKANKGDTFIDFGTHIGWYTLLAALRGLSVIGFEGDAENMKVLLENAHLNGVDNQIIIEHAWIDEHTPLIDSNASEVFMVKSDLEGNDRFAIDSCVPLLEKRHIQYLMVEISPCFNDSYPELVKRVQDYGYDVFDMNQGELIKIDDIDAHIASINQTNYMFVRQG